MQVPGGSEFFEIRVIIKRDHLIRSHLSGLLRRQLFAGALVCGW